MLSLKECIRLIEFRCSPGKAQFYFEYDGAYYFQLVPPDMTVHGGTVRRVDRETGEISGFYSLGVIHDTPGLLEALKRGRPINMVTRIW